MPLVTPEQLASLLDDAEKQGIDKRQVLDRAVAEGFEIPGYTPTPTRPSLVSRAADAFNPAVSIARDVPKVLSAAAIPGRALTEASGDLAERLGRAGVPAPISASVAFNPALLSAAALPQSATEAGVMALAGPLGEAVGGGLRAVAPAVAPFTPTFASAVDAMRVLGNMNILSPAEATGSKALSWFEGQLAKLPFSADVIQAGRNARATVMREVRKTLLDRFGPPGESWALGQDVLASMADSLKTFGAAKAEGIKKTFSELQEKFGGRALSDVPLGEFAQGKIIAEKKLMNTEAHKAYSEAAQALESSVDAVPDTNLLATAKKYLEPLTRENKKNVDKPFMSYLEGLVEGPPKQSVPPEIQAILDLREKHGIMGQPKNPQMAAYLEQFSGKRVTRTYQDMADLRTEITDKMIAENPLAQVAPGMGVSTNKGRILGKLRKAISQDMDDFAKKVGGDFEKKHEIARDLWADFKSYYDNRKIRDIAKADPQAVYSMTVGKESVAATRSLQVAIGENAFNSKFRTRWISDMLGPGIPDPVEVMERFSKADPYFVREMLNPLQQRQFREGVAKAQLPIFMQGEVEKRVSDLLRSSPEAVVDAITKGNQDVARAAIGVLGPQAKDRFGRVILERIIGGADERLFQPAQIANALEKYPPEFLKIFGLDRAAPDILRIKALGEAIAQTTGAMEGIGSAPMNRYVIGLGGAAGVYGTILHPIAGGTVVATALTANGLARLYYSPIGRQLLREGINLQVGQNNRAAMVLATRIAAIAGVKLTQMDMDSREREFSNR